jgi:hypothetical protein
MEKMVICHLEHAMDGLFSAKFDVLGFGVMMLVIISSKKNTGIYQLKYSSNLIGYVSQYSEL